MEQKTDSMEFLLEAKTALAELEKQKTYRSGLALEEKRQERLLEGEKKAVEDEVYRTIRERKAAIEASYDRELAQDKEKLRKLRLKKERAKSIGRQERIKDETSELLAHNQELTTRITTQFQQNGVPGWCNSWLFFALFLPRRAWEWLFDLVLAAAVFVGVPIGLCEWIPELTTWQLMAAYTALIFVIGGGYLALTNLVKLRRYSDLRAGRMMRDERASNRKKIKVITRAIHRDVSEDSYNLDSYNYEIARLEAEIEDVAKRKQENLNTFEAATQKVIADEIMENNKDRILKIQDGYQKLHLQLIDADKQLRAQTMQITANYEPYLGKDFLDSGRVDSLIELVDSGKASTITEAITVYRESKI